MRVDLHMHSTASDGEFPPERVVELAREGHLDLIAIADHDTTSGYAAAKAAGNELAVEVIPAIEMSSTHEGHDLHILGYFIDPDATVLTEHTAHAQTSRSARMERMIERLAEQDVRVSMDAVRRIAGADERRKSIGRPHLARALVEAGYVKTIEEAFNRYISDDHGAFVPTSVQTPKEAIERIRQAGGVSVWAHPPRPALESLLPAFVDAGLGGLEVFRPNHSREYQAQLEAATERYGLVKGGGSDWHGTKDGALGGFYVEAAEVGDLLETRGV